MYGFDANAVLDKYGMNPASRPMPQAMPQPGVSARQGLVGPLMPSQPMSGRPPGTSTGMGMTPPSQSVFNPMLSMMTRAGGGGTGGGLPFARNRADGIMQKYGMMGR